MKKVFILTGESSGDKLASTVITNLKKLNKDVEDQKAYKHKKRKEMKDFINEFCKECAKEIQHSSDVLQMAAYFGLR